MDESCDIHREYDILKQELERLSCELEQTEHEKNLSAQYGLVLLEEKEDLLQRNEELEAWNDSARNELELLREALDKYQTNQKETASNGIEQEESLLLETASIEASFASTVLELEKELKQVRQEVFLLGLEKDRILQENIELAKNCDVSERENRNYKAELKELKLLEARLSSNNNELEEENISLKKQISSLRSSQVEFEGAKHKVCCLQEEVEAAKGQIDELISLKQIAEKQLEGALEAHQSEQEQKHALKQELDQLVNSEPLFNINNVGFYGFGKENVVGSQSSTVGDLYSELNSSEIRKLEKQLEEMENDKIQVSNRLQETRQQLDKTEVELNDRNNRVQRMADSINTLIDLHGKLDEMEDDGSLEDPENDIPEISRLKHLLTKYEQRYQLAVRQVDQLRNDVQGQQEGAVVNKGEGNDKFKNDISEYKIQDDLDAGLEELAQLSSINYHRVCMANNETLDLVHITGTAIDAESPEDAKDQPNSSLFNNNASELDTLKEKHTAFKFLLEEKDENRNDFFSQDNRLIDTIHDHLTKAMNHNFKKNCQTNLHTGNQDSSLSAEEQVIKLTSLLSTKRKQIATLQNVLKANKQTAEVAMATLKSKYESERNAVNKTIMKLQNELKVLREDKDTFESLKAMFAARLDELVAQLDESQRELDSRKIQIHHLNSVLKMSISKNLKASQQAKEAEMDKDKIHIQGDVVRFYSWGGGSGSRQSGSSGYGRNKRRHDDRSR